MKIYRRYTLLPAVIIFFYITWYTSGGILVAYQTAQKCNENYPYNLLPTQYDDQLGKQFRRMVQKQVPADDPELVKIVQKMMHTPDKKHKGKFEGPRVFNTPQAQTVNNIFKNKTGLFFLEAGAYDGETSSNTFYLERHRNWTGLLVELDPFFFTQLIGKNRNVYSINAGLSLEKYPTELPFGESEGQTGKLQVDPSENKGVMIPKAPCIPLESMLLALNRTHIDYFSLDVEGFELNVLKTVPFDRLDITVLSVEHRHVPEGKEAVRTYMEEQGYTMYEDIKFTRYIRLVFVEDYIFVKNSFLKKN